MKRREFLMNSLGIVGIGMVPAIVLDSNQDIVGTQLDYGDGITNVTDFDRATNYTFSTLEDLKTANVQGICDGGPSVFTCYGSTTITDFI